MEVECISSGYFDAVVSTLVCFRIVLPASSSTSSAFDNNIQNEYSNMNMNIQNVLNIEVVYNAIYE